MEEKICHIGREPRRNGEKKFAMKAEGGGQATKAWEKNFAVQAGSHKRDGEKWGEKIRKKILGHTNKKMRPSWQKVAAKVATAKLATASHKGPGQEKKCGKKCGSAGG